MIYFDKVSKIYTEDSAALRDVTLTIEPKEFISIVGHSGAGKTTLLKMILAEEKPSSGKVFFDKIDVHQLSRPDITKYRRRIGTIFQDFRLIPDKTAYENIAFAMEAAGRLETASGDCPGDCQSAGDFDGRRADRQFGPD